MFPFVECSLFITLYFSMFYTIRKLGPPIRSSKKDAAIFYTYLVSMVHSLASLVFGI
ncbi:MAG: hypothetical protein P4M11_09455 [Candidatus Pacebacteria bacterium]|nr:hypothetical protein [Candidatus Paceibacterota bacterium]